MNKIKNTNLKIKTILPFRYPGGKFYALSIINPFIDHIDFDEYREPFFGGGAVFWSREKVKYNWINDIYPDLIKTLKVIQSPSQREKLVQLFQNEKEATRAKYETVRKMCPKSDIDQVYKFYYLNRTSFSGKMCSPSWGYRPKRSLPPYRWKERIIPCGEKLQNVVITNEDFEAIIKAPKKGKQVMMFIDPPYYAVKLNSHYKFDMTDKDHIRLCQLLKETKHKFVLTYDDCPQIRKMYSWAHIYDAKFYYRIDNSQHTENHRKKGTELIITNFSCDA